MISDSTFSSSSAYKLSETDFIMESKNFLSPSPEISRVHYQKRHSLNNINELLAHDLSKTKRRPSSLLGLPRLRSRSQPDSKTVSSLVFRIIVIGSKGVGKTSLIHRYLSDSFAENYRPTVSDIYEKCVLRDDDATMNMLKIYDTAGDLQYEFPAMFELTVAEGDMFALVYSVENRRSFDTVKNLWSNILEKKAKRDGEVPFVLVANKSDVSATRRKTTELEGRKLAEDINCPFYEISAKTRHDVSSIYSSLLDEKERIEHLQGQTCVVDQKGSDVLEGVFKNEDTNLQKGKGAPLASLKRTSLKSRKVESCLIM